MKKEIKEILEDIYELDPSLRERNDELESIINKLIMSRPDIKMDSAFKEHLRKSIMEKINETKQENKAGYPIGFRFSPVAGVLVLLIAVVFLGSYFISGKESDPDEIYKHSAGETGLKKFESQDEFEAYIALSESYGAGQYQRGFAESMDLAAPTSSKGIFRNTTSDEKIAVGSNGRVSETNVQVIGIDEPDILKSNGREIYYSLDSYGYYGFDVKPMQVDEPGSAQAEPLIVNDSEITKPVPPDFYRPEYKQTTLVFNVKSPENIDKISEIDRQGELLLSDDILAIFSGNEIIGYDVSDPENPDESWNIDIKGQLNTARLYKEKLYIVTQTYVDNGGPCPMKPISVESREYTIPCESIYHPISPLSYPVTYHAFRINITNGDIEKDISFVGDGGNSVVYMSEDSLFVTYSYSMNNADLMSDFLLNYATDLFPKDVVRSVDKIAEYDISPESKNIEIDKILQKYFSSIDKQELVNIQNELSGKLTEYQKKNQRKLETTGLIKIGLDNFSIDANGSVPGMPLDQFSLDEYKGNLRIATTIVANNFWWSFGSGEVESINDVYVLDGDLDITGSIEGLGLDERVFSARFIKDRGYVVTFKQTDPFYVLDLSNPENPKMKGELKIPGYSSYLHPLKDDRILGVGIENGRVKLSLFDVSDPSNPEEIDKFMLNEYWSDVNGNHHAFLQDEKYEAFFMPAGSTGYVLSYKNDNLKVEATVEENRARRAIFIDDFMYIFSDNSITLLDESNWEEVNEERF